MQAVPLLAAIIEYINHRVKAQIKKKTIKIKHERVFITESVRKKKLIV